MKWFKVVLHRRHIFVALIRKMLHFKSLVRLGLSNKIQNPVATEKWSNYLVNLFIVNNFTPFTEKFVW